MGSEIVSDFDERIAVIGLGYVGLPLAVELGKSRSVIGFDINSVRIADLRSGVDSATGLRTGELVEANHLTFTDEPSDLGGATIFIVTVPTPVDINKRPDLTPILAASETVGRVLKRGDIVIYESTVYPGATEDDCVPVLESVSGLQYNIDFYCGYSPERINPGDKIHSLATITKVTSGSTPEIAEKVDSLYRSIVSVGTYKAQSIRVAEAAKVIENTQRDLNISLVNELAIIFNLMGIDTEAVLNAAATKWNFLPFQPGLVGGHCIGVDPYYLTHKAEELGYSPQVILAGRRINDGMGAYVAGQMVKAMLRKCIQVNGARVLLLGLTFKENCPDLRNTRVVDVAAELRAYGIAVDIHDPCADPKAARHEYGLELVASPVKGGYDGVILTVAHDAYRQKGAQTIRDYCGPDGVVYDLKHVLPPVSSDLRL